MENERGLAMSERKQMNFRLSQEDFEFLKERAEEQGIATSTLVRNHVLNSLKKNKIKQPKFSREDTKKILKIVAPMGNNLNQIAKWCNTHKDELSDQQIDRLTYNLEQTRKEIRNLWELLN